jgi:hypothetical protein
MSKIYIAGPYTAPTWGDKLRNTEVAMDIAIALIQKGHEPFVPHLTHYLDERAQAAGVMLPAEFWYRYDFQWMPLCDALYFIGPSKGASKERRIMEELGRPIYLALDEVPDLRKGKE